MIKKIIRRLGRFIVNQQGRELLSLFFRFGRSSKNSQAIINTSMGKFHVSDALSFVYQFKDIVFEEIYKFTTEKSSPLIYDCGANVGLSCAYFKKLFPKSVIKAFEADKKIFELLQENILTNNFASVETINKAVWISNDGVQFSSDGADGGSIYGASSPNLIPSVRFRDVITNEKIFIDMLKMDIEGAEIEVMRDCAHVLGNVKNIFIEYHSWQNQTQQLDVLLNILTTAGFRYDIQSISRQSSPFITKGAALKMDLQLNIFAFRI